MRVNITKKAQLNAVLSLWIFKIETLLRQTTTLNGRNISTIIPIYFDK